MSFREGVTFGWAIAVDMLPMRIGMPAEPDRCDWLSNDDGYHQAYDRWREQMCACQLVDDVDALTVLLTDPGQPAETETVVTARDDVYAAANADMMRRALQARTGPLEPSERIVD